MEGEAFAAFVASIAANGLQEEIALYDGPDPEHRGKVLEGRNRERACIEAGVEPRYKLVVTDDPLTYVWIANGQRRHWSIKEKRASCAKTLVFDHLIGDRKLALLTGLNHHTVASVRKDLVAKGVIPKVTARVGRDNKTRQLPKAAQQTNGEPAPNAEDDANWAKRPVEPGPNNDELADENDEAEPSDAEGETSAEENEHEHEIESDGATVVVAPTPPANPTPGMLWWDRTSDTLCAYDGTSQQWIAATLAAFATCLKNLASAQDLDSAHEQPQTTDTGDTTAEPEAETTADSEVERLRAAKHALGTKCLALESEVQDLKEENAQLKADLSAAQLRAATLEREAVDLKAALDKATAAEGAEIPKQPQTKSKKKSKKVRP